MSPRLVRLFRGALPCRQTCLDIQIQPFARAIAKTPNAARMRLDTGVEESAIGISRELKRRREL